MIFLSARYLLRLVERSSLPLEVLTTQPFGTTRTGWLLGKLVRQPSIRGGELVASYLIGGTAAFWVIERTYSFWS